MRKIVFQPQGVTVECDERESILDAARKAELSVEGTCGGRGTCGKCRVRILNGEREEFTSAEDKILSDAEKERGIVLACQCYGKGDLEVYLPQVKTDLTRKGQGLGRKVEVSVDLEKTYLELDKPTVEDPMSDEQRVIQALGDKITQPFGIDELKVFPSLLRKSGFKVTAVTFGGELLGIEAGNTTDNLFGIAYDIGTTTVVGSLVDLNSGNIVGTVSGTNEQNAYGADVLTRIQYCGDEPDGLTRLQSRVVGVMNNILKQLTESTGISPMNIYKVTAVGNTTMAHLLLGLDPANLAPAPFVSVFQSERVVRAKELGIETHPNAKVIMVPNVAGYVGSDTVAVMVATNIEMVPGPSLAIDIGTNGEMVLAVEGRLWTCSTAAGPAFEGAQIRYGMRAAEGAIERVSIEDGEVKLQVIGDVPAVGICGSGLIDAVAELLTAGVIDDGGRILSPEKLKGKIDDKLIDRIKVENKSKEFIFAYGENGNDDVVLTQKDIRELQLAKGAVRAGVEVLFNEAGIDAGKLERVMLAGAFGNYIDKDRALTIGLLPPVEPTKVESTGNSAGDGSLLVLTSDIHRQRAKELAVEVSHIELSGRDDFQKIFIKAVTFSKKPLQ